MNIEDIIAGINAWIASRGAAEHVGGVAIQMQLGIEYSVKHKSGDAPQVIVYPDSEAYGTATRTGVSGATKSLWDVATMFKVECWGADFGDAQLLRNLILRALYHVIGVTEAKPAAGKWNTDTELAQRGRLLEWSFAIPYPVLDAPAGLVYPVSREGGGEPAPDQTNLSAGVELDAGGTDPEPPIDVTA